MERIRLYSSILRAQEKFIVFRDFGINLASFALCILLAAIGFMKHEKSHF